jgi:hypothetical protein
MHVKGDYFQHTLCRHGLVVHPHQSYTAMFHELVKGKKLRIRINSYVWRMKASASVFTITLLLIAAEFTRAASPDLEYSFQRRDSASLLITVSFPANKIGSTLLHLPNEWAGQQMLYKAITELHPVSAGTSVAAAAMFIGDQISEHYTGKSLTEYIFDH